MKFLARDLYRCLKRSLGPELADLGFKPTKSGMLAWTKPIGSEYLTLWFQCDKWGWEADWGSSFTLEFQTGESPEPGTGSLLKRERYCFLLDDVEREDLRLMNNRIIEALPGSKAGRTEVMEVEGERVPLLGVLPNERPYVTGSDIWMHYHGEEDAMHWAQYLSEKLPALIERYSTSVQAA